MGTISSKALTLSFSPKLKFLSDTRILLLYPTVPDLMLTFMLLEACKYFLPRCNQLCFLVTLNVFSNIHSSVNPFSTEEGRGGGGVSTPNLFFACNFFVLEPISPKFGNFF